MDSGARHAKAASDTDERLFAVGAWREAPFFSDAERAALALAKAMTRLSDSTDPIADRLWADVMDHYDERPRTGLILWIAIANLFNRLNVTTRQIAGNAW